jgi:hypothetical protein
MSNPTSNIEAVARNICTKQLLRFDSNRIAIACKIDRYWHCVAAQLESGEIDEAGDRMAEFDHEKSLAAYRDWCQRHPDSR